MNYTGFWSRLLAHNIDLLILLPAYYLTSFFINENGLLYVICTVGTFIYEVAFLAGPWGATPGKRYLRLRVCHEDTSGIGIGASLLRSAVKAVTLITFFIGYATIAIHPKKKGLHDLVAGTVVVFVEGD